MTISRSSGARLTLAALALGLVAAPLAAQQPAAQQPAQQQPAAAPAPPATNLATSPTTHTVQRGETLWGLAKQFLGDPLLWVELYRLNTTVVEDPHWIFPGEELRFVPAAEQVAAAPAPAPAAPAAPAAPGEVTVAPTPTDTALKPVAPSPSGNPFDGPTIFASQSSERASAATLRLRNEQLYRAVRVGEHFAAGFLTEGEDLNAGTLLGNTRTASVRRLTAVSSATTFSEVAIKPPAADSLKPGDYLLAYETPRRIDPYGQVVRPTGLLRVTRVGGAGENATAQVVGVYQSITSGQSVMRVPGFTAPRARSVAVDSGITGQVIDLRDPHELVTIQDVVFIDRGADDSVHLGDMFQISGTTTAASGIGAVVQNEAKVLIVYLRPHTSTGIIVQIDRPDIQPGATARQIRRMPS